MLKNSLVFKNIYGKKIFNSYSKTFRRIVRRAGLTDDHGGPIFSFHDLRRSCATEMLRCGVAPKTVQKILGHASIVTTMRYYI